MINVRYYSYGSLWICINRFKLLQTVIWDVEWMSFGKKHWNVKTSNGMMNDKFEMRNFLIKYNNLISTQNHCCDNLMFKLTVVEKRNSKEMCLTWRVSFLQPLRSGAGSAVGCTDEVALVRHVVAGLSRSLLWRAWSAILTRDGWNLSSSLLQLSVRNLVWRLLLHANRLKETKLFPFLVSKIAFSRRIWQLGWGFNALKISRVLKKY